MTWNSNLSVYKQSFRDFLGSLVVKNLPSNAGEGGSIPGRETGIPRAEGLLSPHGLEPKNHNERSYLLQLRPDAAKEINTYF